LELSFSFSISKMEKLERHLSIQSARITRVLKSRGDMGIPESHIQLEPPYQKLAFS
jgi:hypothetical protein